MSRDRSIKLNTIQTTTPNTVIEVDISYDEGGVNYFHGTTNPRGFNLHATVWTIEGGFRSTVIGTGGLKRQVEEAKRFSQKRLAALADLARTPGTDVARKMDELVAGVVARQGLTIAHPLAQLGAQAVA